MAVVVDRSGRGFEKEESCYAIPVTYRQHHTYCFYKSPLAFPSSYSCSGWEQSVPVLLVVEKEVAVPVKMQDILFYSKSK